MIDTTFLIRYVLLRKVRVCTNKLPLSRKFTALLVVSRNLVAKITIFQYMYMNLYTHVFIIQRHVRFAWCVCAVRVCLVIFTERKTSGTMYMYAKRYQQQQLTSSIMNTEHTHKCYEYVAFHVHIQHQVTTTAPSSYESLQISQKN